MILQLWADVKYYVPTGFGFSPKASGFYPFGDATALAGEGGVVDSSLCLKPQTKGTVLGLYMPKAYQKNRPFGLWFMWFA